MQDIYSYSYFPYIKWATRESVGGEGENKLILQKNIYLIKYDEQKHDAGWKNFSDWEMWRVINDLKSWSESHFASILLLNSVLKPSYKTTYHRDADVSDCWN